MVEIYKNWNNYPDVHTYFFAVTAQGEVIVFHSPTTNGDRVYVKPTENQELQAGFKRVLKGEEGSAVQTSSISVEQRNLTIKQCSN
ncbi:DUF4767 domain-containing protein [Streptococcus marmotae]|uniref:DUF4767 domain-containing protein n=1 Tax=Streptococcus marmotae TaxID=1825069 RepID=UPI0009EE5527